jgi:hypothetical protein
VASAVYITPELSAPSERQRLVLISASTPAAVPHSRVQDVPVSGVWLCSTTPSVSVKLSAKRATVYRYTNTSAVSTAPHRKPHRNITAANSQGWRI